MALNQISSEEILTVFNDEVDLIVDRIDNRKSRKDISKWLDNFEDNDKIDALEILQKLTYVSEDDLRFEADRIVKEVINLVPKNNKIYFYPISKYGKSAAHFSYYINKSALFHSLENSGRAKFIFNKSLAKEATFDDNTSIVFFDDFFGTGNTFIKYYKYISELSAPEFKELKCVYLAGIFYMDKAKQNIEASISNIKLVADIHHKIFDDNFLFFTTLSQNTIKKDLALNYGNSRYLFKEGENDFSLGYENSEALLTFSYAPPNNTLPIIWSNKTKWKPLFPRSEDDIFVKLKEFKQQNAFAATQMQLGMPKDTPEIAGFNRNRMIVVGILRMLNKKTPIPTILLVLGLRTNELLEYQQIGVNMGYFTENMEVTSLGESVLEDILDKIREYKATREKDIVKNEIKYMPKIISVK